MVRYFYATGKRKTSIAKVRLTPKDNGEVKINEKTLMDYFPLGTLRSKIMSPLKLVGKDKDFSTSVIVRGGGINSQAEAIRHGISRALLEVDPEFRTTLKKAGYLTRDPRAKERKKPGLHRARRGQQFSKR